MPRNLLIVDDMRENRLILRRMLCAEYQITEAAGGEEALALLRERHEGFSAVLLDIVMPKMSGFEVLRRIRADGALSRLPVIMITASEDASSRVKALSLGANDYVLKPYSPEIIRHCLQNNIALNEAAATVSILERDKLTGLWNRDAFFMNAAREIEKKPEGYYVLGCLDIKGFKVINDQYGSEVGDGILKALAEGMRQSCREHDGICGRVFADQFISLFPCALLNKGVIGPETLESRIFERTGIRLTLSVGRYIIENKSLSLAAMFDRASIAKSTVKGRYDRHVAVYDERMRDRIVREQKMVNEMNGALAGRQFEVWFQPQYNRATGAMIGAEALVRWRHPQSGLIPPNEFIPLFEQNGFIYEMDKFVWEEVCRTLRGWLDAGRRALPVSVNISRYDALRLDIVETLSALMQKYRLPFSLLHLEITETAFTESSQPIIGAVKELLKRGFTVEIDDFGSGYSSLNTLKDVPAQIIKLDMKFLESTDDSRRGGNIVESIVRMAKWLGMSVIAEGVETLEQADYLRSIGCNYMQGFLYARPMPLREYEAHCEKTAGEEALFALQTVENLDNNAFWDPGSTDTLLFNSYVGAACIFELHNEKMEVVRSTPKFAEAVGGAGLSLEDTLQMDWSASLDAENQRALLTAIARSRETNADATAELLFTGLPGCAPRTFLRCTMRVIAATESRYLVYNLVENVTSRREAERERADAIAQLKSLMRDMPGGFIRLRRESEGRFAPVYINDGMASLTGMSRSELMDWFSKSAFAGIHPDDIAVVRDVFTHMLGSAEAHSVRYRFLRGDGATIWLSVFGRVTNDASGATFLNLYFTDASDQVKREEAQELLMDNLPCGAGIYEFKDGQMSLTYQNRSYWELVGLYEADFPDPAPMSAVHPEDIPLIMQELSDAIAKRRDVSCNIRLRHLTRGYRPVHLVGRIVMEEDGGFLIYATFMPLDE